MGPQNGGGESIPDGGAASARSKVECAGPGVLLLSLLQPCLAPLFIPKD